MSAPPALPVPLPPDVDRSIVLNGTALGLLIPAVLVVIVRVAVRAFMTKNIGWDDWLMIIATVKALLHVDILICTAANKSSSLYWLQTKQRLLYQLDMALAGTYFT